MMKDKHPVVDLIETLYKSRDLIALAYDSDFDLHFDKHNSKESQLIERLSHMQLTAIHHDDSFYLDTNLRRLIDRGLRQDTISYLDADMGSELSGLEYEFNQYNSALLKGDAKVLKTTLRELRVRFLAINQKLNNNAEELNHRTHMHYGRSDYGYERKAENIYFQDQLSKLKESYYQIMQYLENDKFINNLEVDDMVTSLKGRTLRFIDKIDQTLRILRDNAYRIRSHELRSEKLRAMHRHMHSNSTDAFEISAERACKSDYYSRPSPIFVMGIPDISNPDLQPHYADIISRFKQKKISNDNLFTRERSNSVKSSVKQNKLSLPSAERLLKSALIQVHNEKTALLATDLLNNSEYQEDLTIQFWLFYLLNVNRSDKRIGSQSVTDFFNFYPLKSSVGGFTGNVRIKDVIISSKNAPKSIISTIKNEAVKKNA